MILHMINVNVRLFEAQRLHVVLSHSPSLHAGLINTGFMNTGFIKMGFRNTGFINMGFIIYDSIFAYMVVAPPTESEPAVSC